MIRPRQGYSIGTWFQEGRKARMDVRRVPWIPNRREPAAAKAAEESEGRIRLAPRLRIFPVYKIKRPPLRGDVLAEWTGLEPATPSVTG